MKALTLSREHYSSRLMVVTVWIVISLLSIITMASAKAAVINHSGTISANEVWSNADIHRVISTVTVNAGVALTIEPGAIVKFDSTTFLNIRGTLTAIGTLSDKIIFTSSKDDSIGGDTNGDLASTGAPGDWNYLYFEGADSSASILEHAEVRFAGDGAIYVSGSSLAIVNNLISESSGAGVYIAGGSPLLQDNEISFGSGVGIYVNAGTPTIAGNTISDNNNYGLYYSSGSSVPALQNNLLQGNERAARIPVSALPIDVASSNTIIGNTHNQIEVHGGALNHDGLMVENGLYYLLGSVTVNSGSTLNIKSGVVVKFEDNAGLTISGALAANGLVDANIIFTSRLDDSAGGDTNGDGDSSGSTDDWEGIHFEDTSVTSVLDYVSIRYAWQPIESIQSNLSITNSTIRDYSASMAIINSSATIKNNTIETSDYLGMYIYQDQAKTIDIVDNIIRHHGGSGADIRLWGQGAIQFSNNIISENITSYKIGFQYGVLIRGDGILTMSNNTFSGNTFPVAVDMTVLPALINGGNILSDNTHNAIAIVGGTLNQDLILPGNQVYVFPFHKAYNGSDATVGVGSTLTLQANTVLKFDYNKRLNIAGALTILGGNNANENVILTSLSDDSVGGDSAGDGASSGQPGDWALLSFLSTADSSQLDNTEIRFATSGIHHYSINNLSVINSSIHDSQYYGVSARGSGTFELRDSLISNNGDNGVYIEEGTIPTISGNTITGNGDAGIYFNRIYSADTIPVIANNVIQDNLYPGRIPFSALPDQTNANTISGNTHNDLYLLGGTLAQNAFLTSGNNYWLSGVATVDVGTQLTLDPGVILKSDSQIIINGSMQAIGTETAPITFTAATDDSIGNPKSWADETITPRNGDWAGLQFNASNLSSAMNYMQVRYAGANGGSAINLQTSATLENSVISNSAGHGISINNVSPLISHNQIWGNTLDGIHITNSAANPTISNNQISTNLSDGIEIEEGAEALVNNNLIYMNREFGLRNKGSSFINASENWWGDFNDSGPYQESTNVDGEGNSVSNNVDYSAYLAPVDGIEFRYDNFSETDRMTYGVDTVLSNLMQGELSDEWDLLEKRSDRTMAWDSNSVEMGYSGLNPDKQYRIRVSYYNGDDVDVSIKLNDGTGKLIHRGWSIPKLIEPSQYEFTLPRSYYVNGTVSLVFNRDNSSTATRIAVPEIWLLEGSFVNDSNLVNIAFNDLDASNSLSQGDEYYFYFSEVISTSSIATDTHPDTLFTPENTLSYGSDSSVRWINGDTAAVVTIGSDYTISGSELITITNLKDLLNNAVVGNDFLTLIDTVGPLFTDAQWQDNDSNGYLSVGDQYSFYFNESIFGSAKGNANNGLPPENKSYGNVNQISWDSDSKIATVTVTEGFTIIGNEIVYPSAKLTGSGGENIQGNQALTGRETIQPLLNSIDFDDIDGDSQLSTGDLYVFKFSEPMLYSALSSANTDLSPEAKSYGNTEQFSWNQQATELRVYLTAGFTIQGGETIAPSNQVMDRSENPLANTGNLNSQDTQAPEIFASYGSLSSPVPLQSDYQVIVQFNSSMDSNINPEITITDADGTLLNITPTGTWSTTTNNNDTYTSPEISLIPDLTGELQVNISAAADVAGNMMVAVDDAYQFYRQIIAPTISNYSAPPEINSVASDNIILEGTRDNESSIWINGIKKVDIGSGNWSSSITLAQGNSDVSIVAKDDVGNATPALIIKFYLDTIVPVITSTIPADAVHTNINPGSITLNFVEAGSGLNLEKSLLSVTRNGSVVVGDWFATTDTLSFTPQLGFVEGTYHINAQLFDNVDLSSSTLVTSFIYDKTPPAPPIVNGLPKVTNTATLLVSGTKEAYSSIWVNGINIESNTASLTWSYSLTLGEGMNALSVIARDRANNQSAPTVVSVNYDNTPPGSVQVTGTGEGNGNSAYANLDWSAYNELANGNDIDHYEIFINTSDYTDTSMASITGTTGAGVKVFTVTGLVASIDYYIAVVAVDTSGNRLTAVTPVLIDAIDSTPPEEVSNITIASTENSLIISWDHSLNSADDLSAYKLIIANNPAIELLATQNSFTQTGLLPAKAYSLRITAIDESGNESLGVNTTGVTLLNNPSGLNGDSNNGSVDLNWAPGLPADLVKSYTIYFAETAFTSVTGMQPELVVDAGSTSATVAGLTNDTVYYFAVTAVNLSDGENKTVNPISLTPSVDTTGPEFISVLYNNEVLINNAVLSNSGNLVVNATDSSGLSKIEFLVDGVKFAEDVNQADGFSSNLDLLAITDGTHTLGFIGYDSLNNNSQYEIPVAIALAPPAAPTLITPQDGATTNQAQVNVTGNAVKATLVQFYNNGSAIGAEIASDINGDFVTHVDLNEGVNKLSATATYLDGRGGISAESTRLTITVDSSIPEMPTGLIASSLTDGFIKLTWNQSTDSEVVGYDLYRATSLFSEISSAQKINSEPIITSSYSDLPDVDGNYFYRVAAINQLTTSSALSAQVEVLSDRTPPEAVSIEYTPLGNFDAQTGRMAPGQVTVLLTVSEALLTTPFLNISSEGGSPLTVNLNKVSDTEYSGSFTIAETTPTGTANVNFSARDSVGNRGIEIVAGSVIKIDTDGPVITGLTVAPDEPIKNDESSPVDVNFTLQLDESIADSSAMQMRYLLSGEGRTEQDISNSLTQTEATLWWGSLTLPADAGLLQAESLSFSYLGNDDLGNLSTTIQSHNHFQIYQGDLPPLSIPDGLTAVAQPGGRVLLNWQAVTGAVSYQLYRQAPNETEASSFIRIDNTQYLDETVEDGEYLYRVASVRMANGQEGLSAPSEAVNVIADSIMPEAPGNLNLLLNGSGVLADWLAPEEPGLNFQLYRSDLTIIDTNGLMPIVSDIAEINSYDPNPSVDERYYAVTAVDAAGNESIPSNSVYQNVELLPVSSLSVYQTDSEAPVINWSHNSDTIAGYNLYISAAGNSNVPVNNGLLTEINYTDTGYADNTRVYKVVAVDNADIESIGRSVILPKTTFALSETSQLQRGIMNQLEYHVQNDSNYSLSNAMIKITVSSPDGLITHTHSSLPFNLTAGEVQTVPVVFGGYNDLPDDSRLTSRLVIAPETGELITIERNTDITVTDSVLLVNLATQEMTRGVNGKVRFSVENTSAVETEMVLAQGGQSSTEIRVKLLDTDGNIIASQPIKQNLGTQVVQLASGTTVARIAPASEFISDWFDLPIPLSAPIEVIVAIEIDHFHFHLGQTDHVAIDGAYQTQATALIDTSYYGELISVSPQTSDGNENIIITGQAIARSNGMSLPTAPLTIIINANGFQRSFNIYTDSQGQFSYEFKPLANESGSYKVSVIHPDVQDQPEQGQFVINRLLISPDIIVLKIPYNHEQTISINADAKTGDNTIKEIRLDYLAEEQATGEYPEGITVNIGNPVQISSGQLKQLTFTVKADSSANVAGSLFVNVVRVFRDTQGNESSTELINRVTVNYAFAEALPVLQVTPSILETGVSQQSIVNETIAISNKGLATLENINIVLLNEEGSPAPEWLRLTSPAQPEDLFVGQNHSIGISASPDASIIDGTYVFNLRISASNHQMLDIPLVIHVVQSGMGQALFKISDIYTATINAQGGLIEGLSGANIVLQNELVPSVIYNLTSDTTGEALFTDISAGFYKFRVSANNHQEVTGRLTIKPGVTLSQEVFLDYNLVTVEWSVNEITLTDSYDITLSATFETDVPAAVVIAEPSNITLPDMVTGSVYQGEFVLTNYGLVRADNLVISLPPDDVNFKYEFMAGAPESLDAKQSITLAYRVTALKALGADTGGSASVATVAESSGVAALQSLVATANEETDNNCYAYSKAIKIVYDYDCANATRTSGHIEHYLTKTYGQCSISLPNDPTPGGGGGTIIFFPGSNGSGGDNPYTPVYESISGTQCIPRPKDCPTCEAQGTVSAGDQ